MIEIEVTNRQVRHAVDEARLVAAARHVLQQAGVRSGTLSLAVVDDPTIHAVNREYLDHDYPTDVISFACEADPDDFDGEVIVSADTAAAMAARYEWPVADELLLYVVHGTLHLVGYDDLTPEAAEVMRAAEREHLGHLGLAVRGR